MTSRQDLESGARLASLQRASWKAALSRMLSPALRLHHYRTTHNRLLQTAWRELDCPPARECKA